MSFSHPNATHEILRLEKEDLRREVELRRLEEEARKLALAARVREDEERLHRRMERERENVLARQQRERDRKELVRRELEEKEKAEMQRREELVRAAKENAEMRRTEIERRRQEEVQRKEQERMEQERERERQREEVAQRAANAHALVARRKAEEAARRELAMQAFHAEARRRVDAEREQQRLRQELLVAQRESTADVERREGSSRRGPDGPGVVSATACVPEHDSKQAELAQRKAEEQQRREEAKALARSRFEALKRTREERKHLLEAQRRERECVEAANRRALREAVLAERNAIMERNRARVAQLREQQQQQAPGTSGLVRTSSRPMVRSASGRSVDASVLLTLEERRRSQEERLKEYRERTEYLRARNQELSTQSMVRRSACAGEGAAEPGHLAGASFPRAVVRAGSSSGGVTKAKGSGVGVIVRHHIQRTTATRGASASTGEYAPVRYVDAMNSARSCSANKTHEEQVEQVRKHADDAFQRAVSAGGGHYPPTYESECGRRSGSPTLLTSIQQEHQPTLDETRTIPLSPLHEGAKDASLSPSATGNDSGELHASKIDRWRGDIVACDVGGENEIEAAMLDPKKCVIPLNDEPLEM